MAIEITKILHTKNDKVFCELIHSGILLKAYVNGNEDSINKNIGKELITELDFEKVLNSEFIENFEDSNSDIQQTENTKKYTILGTVSSVITDVETIYDIYIQKGPEFLSISSGEWSITPKAGDGVKVVVSELCFYNTNI